MASDARSEPLSAKVRDPQTQRVIDACDAVGAFIEGWGFRSIHGRVWTLLALHRDPMAQTDIADALGVSRSLISLAIAELMEYGLVEPTGDHRNAPYAVRMDVWPVISGVLRKREWMLVERARITLEAAVTLTEDAERRGERTPWDLGRMRVLLGMTELAQGVLRAIIAIRTPTNMESYRKWLGKAVSLVDRLRRALPKP